MAVSLVGTPASVNNGSNYTAESGSNRIVVFAIRAVPGVAASSITAVTFGGVACTIAVQRMESASELGLTGIAYIKESSIPAGAQAVSVTVSAGSVDPIICYTLAGVDQTSTVRDSDSAEVTATATFSVTLTTVAGDYGVLAGFSGAQGTGAFATYANGWAETARSDLGGVGGRTVVAASVACDGTDNISITNSLNGRKSLSVGVFAAASGSAIAAISAGYHLRGMR